MTLKNSTPAKTPNYVLLEGQTRIGPRVVPLTAGPEVLVVYGFSDKEPYDRFTANSGRALRPYPLVTGYLSEPGGQVDDRLRLVVIDATGPDDKCLRATKMEIIAEAQKSHQSHLPDTHRLLFDETASAYSIEENP